MTSAKNPTRLIAWHHGPHNRVQVTYDSPMSCLRVVRAHLAAGRIANADFTVIERRLAAEAMGTAPAK